MVVNRFYSYLFKSVIPSLDEVELVRPIAEKLRGSSDAETLANVSEWLVKNGAPHSFRVFCTSLEWVVLWLCGMSLLYFYEYLCRDLLGLLDPMDAFVVITLTVFTIIGLIITQINTITKTVTAFILTIIVGLVKDAPTTSTIFYSGVLLGALLALMSYSIFISPRASSRNLIDKVKTYLNFLLSSCRNSMHVKEILGYGMGVCRDYSKLALSLLVNLYPNNKILLFTSFRHVATGIELKDKVYVVEPGLPLLPPRAWLRMTGFKVAEVFEVVRTSHGFTVKYVNKVVEKGLASIIEWNAFLERIVGEIEKAVKVGTSRVIIDLETLAQQLDLEDRVVAESLQRIIRTYVRSKTLESYLRYVKNVEVIRTEAGPSIEISLEISGKGL